jgi:hypothetical protein
MNQSTLVQERPAVLTRVIPPASNRVTRVIIAGLLLTIALVVVQAISQVIDFKVFNLRIRALNSDKHDSLFGLASLVAQAAVAAACGLRGGMLQGHRWSEWLGTSGARRHRGAWLALGALVFVLVIVRGLTTFNATVLAIPLVCVFIMLCWLTWRDPGIARFVVWTGLVLMALSLLLHKVGLAADASTASDYTWAYQLTGIVKHGAELAGWMLLATGVIAGGSQGRQTTGLTARSDRRS